MEVCKPLGIGAGAVIDGVEAIPLLQGFEDRAAADIARHII